MQILLRFVELLYSEDSGGCLALPGSVVAVAQELVLSTEKCLAVRMSRKSSGLPIGNLGVYVDICVNTLFTKIVLLLHFFNSLNVIFVV